VLHEGETRVGKRVVAGEIHVRRALCARPLIPVDCKGFSSQLIEFQLFGHVKRALTGAMSGENGRKSPTVEVLFRMCPVLGDCVPSFRASFAAS
jgi:transcriptional regulator with GAF, ATPase, and Fis domain